MGARVAMKTIAGSSAAHDRASRIPHAEGQELPNSLQGLYPNSALASKRRISRR
jgi:hypothetical protein